MKRNLSRKKRCWLMLTLLFMCLFGGSSGLKASVSFENYCKITNHPTADKPYIEVEMVYYDADGNDSYFTHKGEDKWVWSETAQDYKKYDGPAIYVDDHFVAAADAELAWPGGDNTGNGTGAKNYCSNNGWLGNYWNKYDGVEYRVRFYDPWKVNDDRCAIHMYIWMSQMEVGSVHTVRIHGFWKINNIKTYEINYTMTTNAVPEPWGVNNLPTAAMTGYNKVKVTGALNSSHTTTVGVYKKSNSTNPGVYKASSALSQQNEFKNSSNYELTATHERGDDLQDTGTKIAVEYIVSKSTNNLGTTTFWKWYDVNVPGFVKPENVTCTADPWKKKITVKWKKVTNNNRSQAGTWSIYRDGTRIKYGLSYNSDLVYEDLGSNSNGPDWDDNDVDNVTSKTYKVVFVPNDSPENTTYSSLTSTVGKPVQLRRDWQISITGELKGDDQIYLTWSHDTIKDASSSNTYNMKLERTDDGNNWVWVKDVPVSSPSIVDGNHTDNGLQATHGYRYRLRVELMEKTFDATTDFISTNGSQILAFTATRGTYNNVVKLAWEVKQAGVDETSFVLMRRPLGTAGEDNGWQLIHSTSGLGTRYSYDDESVLPGTFNQYKLYIVGAENAYKLTDGFTFSTGVISGRIKYGTGTAVEGVKVSLKQQNGDGDLCTAGMSSLQFSTKGSGMIYMTEPAEIQKLFKNDYSFQMWLRPDPDLMSSTGTDYFVYDVYYVSSLLLTPSNDGFQLVPWVGSNWKTPITIPANQWSHVTVTYSQETDTLKVMAILPDGTVKKAAKKLPFEWSNDAKKADYVRLALENTRGYLGYMDEFRFFTKALTEKEVMRNYNHPLAGNEDALAIYYPFDEGLSNQKIAYDYSKTNGIPNGRHGTNDKVAAYSSNVEVPSEDQLSMMAYTDVNGNYTIRGVQFQGEGTPYSVIPFMGIHEFSPTEQPRFVSAQSLIHNSVDFEDVSSFPVSGRVIYSGTDYPVQGCNLYVDGTICSQDGKMIETDEFGTFEISVPIGEHYIEVMKNGHVFANGRYPAYPEKFTFDREKTGLEFRDTTLVNFTGHVVGGDIEGKKSVGFGLSKNNIGVTEIILTPLDERWRINVRKHTEEGVVSYPADSIAQPVPSATDKINSKSWRGAKDDCKRFYIHTDSLTGEFSALLPPLEYKLVSMKLLRGDQREVGVSQTLDMSNPNHLLNDTLYNEDKSDYELYEYNTCLRQTYHSDPSFTVQQEGREDGSFGIDKYKFKDAQGEEIIDDIYSVAGDGTVKYNYGGPLFVQYDPYTFLLKGFEEYVNADNEKVDHVPLAGSVVTINNALSGEQSVYLNDGTDNDGNPVSAGQVAEGKANIIELDDQGEATYYWKAGLPNVAKPYRRSISMSYDINGLGYDWSGNGMQGIILGDLPTGNNFVTTGPDKLLMILRDPPGTGSSAEWSTGTVSSTTTFDGDTFSESFEAGIAWHFGLSTVVYSGTNVAGAAGGKVTFADSDDDLTTHALIENESESSTTVENSITITTAVATSEEPDFVGADGDVFIGQATNIIFGNARNVGFHRDGDGFGLDLQNVITTGVSFGTTFNYTQSYIENTLFPNYEMIRENLLVKDGNPVTEDFIKNFKNSTDHAVYLTTLTPDDPDFGKNGTYVGFSPRNAKGEDGTSVDFEKVCTDSIKWINCQIENWKKYLELNESEKVMAYKMRENKEVVRDFTNYSFNSGASVTHSIEKEESTTSSYEWTISAGVLIENEFGFKFDGFGFDVQASDQTMGGRHVGDEQTSGTTSSFSYTLAEEGSDALTVDVYEYGAFGPIFRTRGGQTSNPYEGEVRTKYYEDAGTYPVIMEATMQIEMPTIGVDVPVVNDIPTGSAADYILRLGNQSEIGEDVAYKLFMLDETNPNGAQLSIDGKVLTEGRMIKVPGGQTLTKTLQLRQTNTSILDYENIGIVFASESQPEEIADTIFISAHFTPSSSPVTLVLSNSIINTHTGTNLTLTFKDFDRNYHNLKAIRLQYRKEGSADWTQLHEYVLNKEDLTSNNDTLPKKANVSYILPMDSWPDGNYVFRCVSAATYGNGEVCRYSDELSLVKDMMRPRPLGTLEPSDGVLDIGDDISITFNEPIVKGLLTKDANFLVTGVLNGAEVAHETALAMTNSATAAQTEASINLSGKDFSIDTWVNIGGAGTLLSHGQGSQKLTVGVNNDDLLVVTIAGNTYKSEGSVPKDKWAFLTMNITAAGKLSATIATADEEVELFKGTDITSYEGNGPLAVGKGMTGAIHELLLWDEAHDLTVALANRSKTKVPSTRHLIGYWKMDEGEGKEIRDYSRNRHMTMPNETWFINNENKAVALDGQHYIDINASMLPTTTADDYALEFWMRGDEQTGEAQLMQMGDIALWLNKDGVLQLTGKSAYDPDVEETSTLATTSGKLTDNVWHHVALNVLRQGAAAVYVDGKRCLTTNSSNVGNIVTNKMIVGARRTTVSSVDAVYSFDRAFAGQVDEIRVWNATINGDMLAKNRKVRFTGKESGLVAYYPFEIRKLDDYNQLVTQGNEYDLCGSGLSAKLTDFNSETKKISYVDEAPALRTKPTATNVSFTYTANNEKIFIEIDEDPATIEGCTLTFSVYDVLDENGNNSLNAVWTAFINQNELVWADDVLSLEQEVKTGGSITATIVNKGGQQQMWTLSGLPSWLTASAEYGTTNPRSETEITFTVSESTPIGKYEETVYLKGNNGIETPLTLNITVTGAVPNWSVNPKDFEFSMNVIGRVEIKNIPMDDEDDIVAAFIGEECRGVAHPIYMERYDGSFITMDIYGNDEAGEEVTFRAYDASTGTLYPVVTPDRDITFVPLALEGKYDNPVVFTVEDLIEQQTELKKGWNWLSLYVVTDNMTVPGVFEKIADNVLNVKSQSDGWLTNEESSWGGNLGKLYNEQMYAVQLDANRTLRIVGKPVDPNKTSITVGNGWNWIGYYGRQVSSVSNALAGLQPEDSDILKGQSGVTYFDDYEWAGTLNMMEPGVGYMLKSITDDDRQFSYPTSAFSGPSLVMKRAKAAPATEECIAFKPVNFRNYANNAIMAAKVVAGDRALGHVELGVFADEECRTASVTNDEGIAFLTIPGDDEATLTFKVAIGNQIVDAETTVNFEVDGVYGSPKHPIIIDLSELTGIWEILGDSRNASVYDLQGRKIRLDDNSQRLSKGVYIINGQKKTVK